MNRLLIFLGATTLACAAPFDLRDGDRVLLLGDALLERENTLGYIEAHLHAAWPQTKFTVRNLAWAGDTPRGWSRASFDAPEKGFERLKEQVALVKPSVVILGYGMAASLQEVTDRSGDILLNRDTARYGAEPMSAERYKKELGELMTEIQKASGQPRFILLTPIAHEDLRKTRPAMPNPEQHNTLLQGYTRATLELASERGALVVNLFDGLRSKAQPLTQNGIHLTDAGNRVLALHLATQIKGSHLLQTAAVESTRAAILRKNDLFFHRTRPANSTYLFGFRKHEQGRNAAEIPQFDPLVDKVDEEIDTLKRQITPVTASTVTPTATPAALSLKPLAMPSFTVQEGYEITLWADTNLVGKPVGMNWDEQGRLWVACSPVYPQIQPGEHPEDKVVVLEDTNRDGKADRSTLFEDNLLIAAGVAPESVKMPDGSRRWAAYVGASTELVHVTDTDGDGDADERRVVFSGFGTEDTHHTLHTLRWGPDEKLYFNQSIYIHSHLETPHGMVRLNSGGIFAYDPRSERLEVFAKGWCNPWGHDWDHEGHSFVTDGAGFQGISWAVPGAMYFTYENARKIMPSISPGNYPKFCGLELIRSPLFPADWQGNAITCDFRAHRIARFQIHNLSHGEKARAGYVTKEQPDLVRTTDSSFRPIDVKTGPDGALYVADWTNPVINHGEVDFRDPRRDKVNGRIWRIAPKGKPSLAWGTHSTATPRVIPKGRNPQDAAKLIRDANPRVRVEAMRALSRVPSVENAALVLEAAVLSGVTAEALPGKPATQFTNSAASETHDSHYAYAAWLSVNDLAPHVIEWIESERAAKTPQRDAMAVFALQSLPSTQSGPLLSRIIAGRGLTKDGPWLELIGQAGGPAECDAAMALLRNQHEPRAAAALVAAARRGVKPTKLMEATFITEATEPVLNDVLRLAGLWKVDAVEAIATSIKTGAPSARLDAAFEALATLATPKAAQQLTSLLTLEDAAIKLRALSALAKFQPDTALASLSMVSSVGDESALVPLFRRLFQSDAFKSKFAKAIPADLPPRAAAAALRAARELGRKGETLVNALTPIVGVPTAPLGAGDIATLVRMTQINGNPIEGERVYRRAALACTVCHAIGGAGGKVGPDMTTIGASAPLDYLVESLLAPNAKVKEGYHAIALTLQGGRSASGVLLRETPDQVILRDATGNETLVAKSDIIARENIGSIMPAGLINGLTEREKSHMFAFLSQLGKPGPFDATKATVARTWELFPSSKEADVQQIKSAVKALTYVDGRLTRELLQETLPMLADSGSTLIAVARFHAADPVKARFHLQGTTKAWLNGQPLAIASDPNPVIDLTAGNHTLSIRIDKASIPEVIRVESGEVRFLNE